MYESDAEYIGSCRVGGGAGTGVGHLMGLALNYKEVFDVEGKELRPMEPLVADQCGHFRHTPIIAPSYPSSSKMNIVAFFDAAAFN